MWLERDEHTESLGHTEGECGSSLDWKYHPERLLLVCECSTAASQNTPATATRFVELALALIYSRLVTSCGLDAERIIPGNSRVYSGEVAWRNSVPIDWICFQFCHLPAG